MTSTIMRHTLGGPRQPGTASGQSPPRHHNDFEFRCDVTGLPIICSRCQSCEVQRHMLNNEVWFGQLPGTHQRRFLFRLIDAAPVPFLQYIVNLLQPLKHRDTLYALHNTKGVTDGAKAEVLLSSLHEADNTRLTQRSRLVQPGGHKSLPNSSSSLTAIRRSARSARSARTARVRSANPSTPQSSPPTASSQSQLRRATPPSSARRRRPSPNQSGTSGPVASRSVSASLHPTSPPYGSVSSSFATSNNSASLPAKGRRRSHAALAATVNRRMGETGLQVGVPRTFLPGLAAQDESYEMRSALAWFAMTTHWCRLAAFQRLHRFAGVDLLRPLVNYAEERLRESGPDEGTAKCDIIKLLPPPLSKYLMGFFTFRDLQVAAKVSVAWRDIAVQVMEDQTHRRDADDLILDLRKNHARAQNTNLVQLEVPTEHGSLTITQFETDIFCGLYSVLLVSDISKNIARVLDFRGGEHFVTGSADKLIRVYNASTGRVVQTISGHAGSIRGIAMSDSLNIVVSGSYDTSVRVWSMADRSCITVFRGHKSTVVTVSICEEALLVASGGRDRCLIIWSLRTGAALHTRHTSAPITTCRIMCDHVLFACEDGTLTLLQLIRSGARPSHGSAAPGEGLAKRQDSHVAVRPHMGGASNAAAHAGRAPFKSHLIDPVAVQEVFTVQAHDGMVRDVHLTEYLAISAGEDGACHIWAKHSRVLGPMKTLRHLQAVTACRLADGRVITSCTDGKMRVWVARTGHCVRIFRGNANCFAINDFAFGNADRMIISTSETLGILSFSKQDQRGFSLSSHSEDADSLSNAASSQGSRQQSRHDSDELRHSHSRHRLHLEVASDSDLDDLRDSDDSGDDHDGHYHRDDNGDDDDDDDDDDNDDDCPSRSRRSRRRQSVSLAFARRRPNRRRGSMLLGRHTPVLQTQPNSRPGSASRDSSLQPPGSVRRGSMAQPPGSARRGSMALPQRRMSRLELATPNGSLRGSLRMEAVTIDEPSSQSALDRRRRPSASADLTQARSFTPTLFASSKLNIPHSSSMRRASSASRLNF
ncbi:uncharacterized protein MONBRDRAFT_27285 [Monosiga brevicollis MX1]|uniref:F-box domain-containing protein n=1 Tax=Monosiga brevicollis TaxID=81824 RepID=A9V4V0_MONBE|nr:uncharacterized protein MONBRDRAFT_27285 [Monosiga brevicollis MX1]EDQ87519.1 predicted protein [Monosiga brevicollis MX1]|eukprot:XP_001747779.1 hypothetical protein [Monosiga brevicollis MX1]